MLNSVDRLIRLGKHVRSVAKLDRHPFAVAANRRYLTGSPMIAKAQTRDGQSQTVTQQVRATEGLLTRP